MNKKILAGIAIASILIVYVGAITVLKLTLGDDAIELPAEEEMEKILDLQEGNKRGEYAEEEAQEHGET
jgi:hypothetical protein